MKSKYFSWRDVYKTPHERYMKYMNNYFAKMRKEYIKPFTKRKLKRNPYKIQNVYKYKNVKIIKKIHISKTLPLNNNFVFKKNIFFIKNCLVCL